MRTEKTSYEAPEVLVMSVEVEKGFATSGVTTDSFQFVEDGILDELGGGFQY